MALRDHDDNLISQDKKIEFDIAMSTNEGGGSKGS